MSHPVLYNFSNMDELFKLLLGLTQGTITRFISSLEGAEEYVFLQLSLVDNRIYSQNDYAFIDLKT